MSAEWTTIESDPGVFTELIERMGVKGVQMEEVYSLDQDTLQTMRPVYGLIFLFKWQKEIDDRVIDLDYESKGVFFANQVINNACATQAIVSVLLNCPELDVGPELQQLKEFTAGFPAEMKGLAIGNSDTIRGVHNSFTPPQSIISDEKSHDKDDEAFHFIAYVPVSGGLYELDGLKPGPIRLADCSKDNWLDEACTMISERIGRYAAHEIKFNLMAVVRNRKDVLQEQLDQDQKLLGCLQSKLNGTDPEGVLDAISDLPNDIDTATARLREAAAEIERTKMLIAIEEEKMSRWKQENLRRKTDYIPLAFNILKALAEAKQLQPLVDKALKNSQTNQS